jgi:hypothetical protein
MITENNPAQKSIATEKHYSPREVADIYNVSVDTVIRWFRDVPGVIVVGNRETLYKRKKQTMRIPESVLHWFHEQHRAVK